MIFSKYDLKYLIVGGEAVIYYGYARLTGDIDFFYNNSPENVDKLYESLLEFWEGVIPGVSSVADFLEDGIIIQFGQPPNRIDLINSIDGVIFEEAWNSKVQETITIKNQNISFYYIGLEALIKNKQASSRYKDLDDLRFLSKLALKIK